MPTCFARAEGGYPSFAYQTPGHLGGINKADSDLSIVEKSTGMIQKRLHDYLAQYKRGRNDLLPVNQLPMEVLLQIFSATLDDTRSTPFRIRALHALASVSKRWDTLVRGSPSLWTVASTDGPSWQVSTMLRRSRHTPLDVVIRNGAYQGDKWRESVLDPILHQSDRWRSLTLGRSMNVDVKAVMSLPMPKLVRLDIEDSRGMKESFDLSAELLSRLQELRLRNVNVQWDPLLRNLSALDLCSLAPPSRLSLTQISTILGASEFLESLSLGRGALADAVPDSSAGALLVLAHLTKLSLKDLPVAHIAHLMISIHAPKCRSLEIISSPDETGTVTTAEPLSERISHWIEPVRRILLSIESLVISVFGLSGIISDLSRPTSLNIKDPYIGEKSFLSWFDPLITSLSAALPINLNIRNVLKSDILLNLGLLDAVTELHIVSSHVPAAAWTKHLGTPMDVDGVTKWPLPLLQILEFDNCNPDPVRLLNMIAKRYKKGDPRSEGRLTGGRRRDATKTRNRSLGDATPGTRLKRHLPAALKILAITGDNSLSYREQQRLEKILGIIVRWNDPEDLDDDDD